MKRILILFALLSAVLLPAAEKLPLAIIFLPSSFSS